MNEDFVETAATGEVTPKRGANSRMPYAHQSEAINAMDSLNKKFSAYGTLVVLPTGGGKTYTASTWLLRNALDKGKKILWLAHRQTLLEQAAESFKKFAFANEVPHISSFSYRIISGATSHERTCDIQPSDNLLIIGKDSIGRNLNRLDGWLVGEDEIFLVVDEAHHATAKTYRKVIDYVKERVKNLKLIGLTATPFRTAESEQGLLAKIFPDGTRNGQPVKNDVGIVYQVGLKELINRRILSTPKFETYYTDEEYGAEMGLKAWESIQHLDKLPEDVAEKIAVSTARNNLIVETYKKKSADYGQTIVFTVSIHHAIALTKLFKKAGIKAEYVVSNVKDAGTGVTVSNEDNERKLESYRKGEVQVLVNVNILTEGVDLPMTKTVFLARPTVSTVLMTQMVGRALRGEKAGGTSTAYIVSFVDNWNERIAWVNPDTLFTGTNDFSENDPENQKRALRLISIAKIEEFASILSDNIDTTKLETVPFAQRIPLGMYAFQYLNEDGVDFSYQVMVYDSTKAAYEKFMAALPNLSEDLNSAEEFLPKKILDKLVDECGEKFFAGEMVPPYDERDVRHILKYFAQKGECPNFYLFENIDRDKLDVSKIAQEIFDKDMRRSEKNAYLNELWENGDENILRLFFGKKMYFLRMVDSELFKLENPEYYQPNQDNVINGKKNLEQLTLHEMGKINPELERELREGAFQKAKVEGGYRCANCGKIFPDRRYLQVDHIKAMNNGGLSVPENLQILCRSCNSLKSDGEKARDGKGDNGGNVYYIDDPKPDLEDGNSAFKQYDEFFENAFVDKNGKYIVMVLYEGDGPMAYILDKNLRKIRLKSKFCDYLIESGRAIKLSPEEINSLKSSDEQKLESAFKDENGKYIVTVLYEHPEHFDEMTYILDNKFNKIRLKTRFCHELLECGRAVKVSPDEFNEIIRTKKLSSLQRD